MASQQPEPQPVESTPYGLDDITALDFPVAMRGFERDAVKRRLRRVASFYAATLRQRDLARVAAEDANERAVAAEAEIEASARNVADLTKHGSVLESELAGAQARIKELDRALARAASEREASQRAQADLNTGSLELEQAQERVAELEQELEQARAETSAALDAAAERVVALEQTLEQARAETSAALDAATEREVDNEPVAAAAREPEEAGELLVAALRAAEALRAAVRDEAQRALKKTRERAAKLERQAERQRRALEEARAQAANVSADAERVRRELESARAERAQAERDAEVVRERVRVEAEHTLGALQQQRQRVQSLLGDALAALDEDTGDARDVLDDLAQRLHPQTPDPG